jgi:proton-dependent oligopeptide transporter, POT family
MNKQNIFPKGIAYIIGNEAAERYSYYGMKAILVVFLTSMIYNNQGQLDPLSDKEATAWNHLFVFGVYGISILGALLSDIYWGKYRTIIRLSILYVIGHLFLALFENYFGFFVGLTLIAIGSGGIKPSVSAHLGDQFDESNKHLLDKIFFWFYLAINAGAFFAYFSAERILKNPDLGSKVAFGLPGIFMLIATIVFYLGRKKYISIKPVGWEFYKSELFSDKGKKTILKLLPVYLFIPVFWALYDQGGSTWVIQASSPLMDKRISFGSFSYEFFPSEIGYLNPLLIVILIPIFTLFLYPYIKKHLPFGYMQRIFLGMLLCALSFIIISWSQEQIDKGISVSIGWQMLAYVIITISEIFVSVSVLEFSYTQAPTSLKSIVSSLSLFTVALGQIIVMLINHYYNTDNATIDAGFFWIFVGLMFATAILFYLVNRNYKEEIYIQSSENIETT